MAGSVIEIVNLALTYLGEPAIVSLSGNQKAQALSAYYDQSRDEVLAYHPWSCALTRKKLTQLEIDNLTDFAYAYGYPSDCLRVMEVTPTKVTSRGIDTERHMIEGNIVYSDFPGAVLRYIRRETLPTAYPPYLVEAIATNLARKIAASLIQSADVASRMTQLYFTQLAQAMQLDSLQQVSTPAPPEQWDEVF